MPRTYAPISTDGRDALRRVSQRTGISCTEITSRLAQWSETIDPVHLSMILKQFPPESDICRLLLERLTHE